MNRPYEFIIYLNRLRAAYNRFGLYIWALNTAVIAIAIYAVTLLIGIPAFTEFYWRDSLLLANSPAIMSLAFGALVATLVGKRDKSDLYRLLGPELSEKAQTGYDNRDDESLPMQSLAEDLKGSLSRVQPSKIFDWRQIRVRAILAIVLAGATIFIASSQISADITPNDFQSISDLRDRAIGIFKNETPSQKPSANFLGNSSIYGKPSLAVLNENKLQLELYPGVGAGSRARNTTPMEHMFQQSQPGEAAPVPSDLYIESLPPQNREIIKKYFENLAGG
ncbi:MAG: hypothetical protein ACE14P_10770 [Methanotrichaceae archaeon]